MNADIENLPVGVFFEDINGTIKSCNKLYLKTLGLDEPVKGWREMVDLEDSESAQKEWDGARSGKKSWRIKCRLKKSNGNTIWVDIKANPLMDARGDLQGYMGVLTDITNQAMFERLLERFKKAVEKTDSQIVFTDAEGLVVFANDAVEKLTGFTSGEVVGTKAGKLWGGLMEVEFYKKLWQKIKIDKMPFDAEIINKKKNGETYFAQINITPILDSKGEVEFFVGIERDITYYKEMDKVKREFISVASHQLRTPLSSIKWLCELFWNGDLKGISSGQKEIVQKVQNENERLIKLVDSLLNISRIESGKIVIEPSLTDIPQLVEKVLSDYKESIKSKKQTVEVKFPVETPKLSVDSKLVGEALSNLISNAHKYTPVGGRLWVKGKVISNELIISVADNGIGIPVNDKRRIFEKFFRAENALLKQANGSGLGLYFVKWVAESHGGLVWFESTENVGTTFYMSLPLSTRHSWQKLIELSIK